MKTHQKAGLASLLLFFILISSGFAQEFDKWTKGGNLTCTLSNGDVFFVSYGGKLKDGHYQEDVYSEIEILDAKKQSVKFVSAWMNMCAIRQTDTSLTLVYLVEVPDIKGSTKELKELYDEDYSYGTKGTVQVDSHISQHLPIYTASEIKAKIDQFEEFKATHSPVDKEQPTNTHSMLAGLFAASVSGSAECKHYLHTIKEYCYIDGENSDIANYYTRLDRKMEQVKRPVDVVATN